MPTFDAAFARSAASLGETAGYAILADAGMAALAKVDRQGTFGIGPDRDRLLLLIVTDGTEFDRSDESARRLNPPAAYAAYANHFPKAEGEFRTADAVTVAPGGRSVFTFTVRRDPDKVDQGEFIAELTGCDVRETTLSRTWTHRSPCGGRTDRSCCRWCRRATRCSCCAAAVARRCSCRSTRWPASRWHRPPSKATR